MNPAYPSIDLLAERAVKRLPRFVRDYLVGGCHSDVSVAKNTDDIRKVELKAFYLRDFAGADLKVNLLGQEYELPFGIAPIGLQGLVWPKATEILAAAARANNIPFVLSTVATASIETVAEITDGRFWFQLYHPAEDSFRDALLDRAKSAGCDTLVILADTPIAGYRPRDIRNGLTVPPRMTMQNIFQMLIHPTWALGQLAAGRPEFATLKPYLPSGKMKDIVKFHNKTFDGRLNENKLRALREKWQGKLVVKGIMEAEDLEKAIQYGMDGAIVSNHGGRQQDASPSTISVMPDLARQFGDKITLMIDSGIRSGPDIAACLASGAQFCFVGRAAMYGVCALGKAGGQQVIDLLERSLTQIMEQIACEKVSDLPEHLIARRHC